MLGKTLRFPRRFVLAAVLVLSAATLSGCNDPGFSSDNIFLIVDADGNKEFLINACYPISSIEFAEGDNLAGKAQIKAATSGSTTITVELGPQSSFEDPAIAHYVSGLEPPFTVWVNTDRGLMGAYFQEWPANDHTAYYQGESLDATVIENSQPLPDPCNKD